MELHVQDIARLPACESYPKAPKKRIDRDIGQIYLYKGEPRKWVKSYTDKDGNNIGNWEKERDIKRRLKPKQREINQLVVGEIWKIIPDFKKYEASIFGRIRNFTTKRMINPSLLGGYCVSSLRKK